MIYNRTLFSPLSPRNSVYYRRKHGLLGNLLVDLTKAFLWQRDIEIQNQSGRDGTAAMVTLLGTLTVIMALSPAHTSQRCVNHPSLSGLDGSTRSAQLHESSKALIHNEKYTIEDLQRLVQEKG